MRRVAVAAYAVLLASLAWTTLPQLAGLIREALQLRPMSYKQRRSVILGSFYDQTRSIDAAVPKDEKLAILFERDSDIDGAVMFDYYVYPRRTRIFPSLATYRTAPDHPREIVYFDLQHGPEPRHMSYGAIRAEQMGSGFVSSSLDVAGRPLRDFVIPLVASIDGPVATYTTEAVIENPSPVEVKVSLRLYPSRVSREVVIPSGGRMAWNDFVYQNFGLLEYGWLRVSSDQPLRTHFQFVNRTTRSVEEVPPVTNEATTSAHLNAPTGARLWIVNFNEGDVGVLVNGRDAHLVPPLAVRDFPAQEEMRLVADKPFLAFTSRRDAQGRSRFGWPEQQ